MFTLLAKYLAKPTAANAAKIAYYSRKHKPLASLPFVERRMMAECLLAGDYLALGILREALEMAKAV